MNESILSKENRMDPSLTLLYWRCSMSSVKSPVSQMDDVIKSGLGCGSSGASPEQF